MRRGSILTAVARRLPNVDPVLRAELAESLDVRAGSASTRDRCAELVSLAGFGLTSWARIGAGDNRRETLRQGVRLAGLITAPVVAVIAVAGGHWALTICAAVVTVAIAGGSRRLPAIGAAAMVAIGSVATPGLLVALAALVFIEVCLGRPFDGRRCLPGGMAAAIAVCAVVGVAWLWPVASALLLGVLSASMGLLFVAIGWFEPRFAVAGTLILLATTLHHGVASSVANATSVSLDGPVGTIQPAVAMCLGVFGGVLVSHRSLRRAHGHLL